MTNFNNIKTFIEAFEAKHERPFVVAVDFDGTLCKEAFPEIGEDKPLMIMLVKTLQQLGAYTILWTCRAEDKLEAAKQWCEQRGLCFMKYNENADFFKKKYNSCSVKVFADIYIDDKAYNALNSIKDINGLWECMKQL